MLIKDEKKRMIAYAHTAENICDNNCSECLRDNRTYEGLGVNYSIGCICPVGLALGRRIEKHIEDNSSEYSRDVMIVARDLKILSLMNHTPEEIKDSISKLRTYLLNDESQIITVSETLKVPQIKTNISSLSKKFSTKLRNLVSERKVELF